MIATTASPCVARDLAAAVWLQGAAGRALGGFEIRNESRRVCSLGRGRPGLALYRADGRRVKVTLFARSYAVPSTKPAVVLRPGRRAVAWIDWPSYCGSLRRRPFRFVLTLSTGTRVAASTRTAAKCYPTGRDRAGPGVAGLFISRFSQPLSP